MFLPSLVEIGLVVLEKKIFKGKFDGRMPHHVISSHERCSGELIITILKIIKGSRRCFRRKIWLYDRGDYVSLNNMLPATDWDSLLIDVEYSTDNVTNAIITTASECTPNTQVTIRRDDVPWMNNDTGKYIRKCTRAHRKYKTKKYFSFLTKI